MTNEEGPEASWQIKTCVEVHAVLTWQQSQLKQIDFHIRPKQLPASPEQTPDYQYTHR